MTEVELGSKPEATQSVASIRQNIGDWASKNARLLFWLVVLLAFPYLFTCWGIAMVVARGTCGGG